METRAFLAAGGKPKIIEVGGAFGVETAVSEDALASEAGGLTITPPAATAAQEEGGFDLKAARIKALVLEGMTQAKAEAHIAESEAKSKQNLSKACGVRDEEEEEEEEGACDMADPFADM
jgi:hypothetical protein